MTIRVDSPFFGITEEEKRSLLNKAENENSLDEIAEYWERRKGIETNRKQVKRFLQRLKLAEAIHEGVGEELEGFASRSVDGKVRDGLIEASRQQLFEDALAKGNSELLLELYRSANDERAREREVEVARRKAAVAEENSRIGWRRLELDTARSALKLLPRLQALVTEGTGTAEERLARVRECLAGGGGRLLSEGTPRMGAGAMEEIGSEEPQEDLTNRRESRDGQG